MTARSLANAARQQRFADLERETVAFRRAQRSERAAIIRRLLAELKDAATVLANVEGAWEILEDELAAGKIEAHFKARDDVLTAGSAHEFMHEMVQLMTGEDRDGSVAGRFFLALVTLRGVVPPPEVSASWNRFVVEWLDPVPTRVQRGPRLDFEDVRVLSRLLNDVEDGLDEFVAGSATTVT